MIIGTGLGGLTTGLRLAKLGYSVEMIEKYHQPGGRLNQLKKDGFTFDTGPTFFSMSYEFRSFAGDCGIDMPFEFVELDPLYSVSFSGRDKYYLVYKDIDKLAAEFADEPFFKERVNRYLDDAGRFFHATEYPVVKRNFYSLFSYAAALAQVPLSHSPKLFRSYWRHVGKYFSSYEAKVIFSLVAFFLGSTPFETSAVFSLLNYTELKHDGYYNVKGGMYKIVEGMLHELQKCGVAIHYNTEIVDFIEKNNRISSFVDQYNKRWEADQYVVNADAASFRGSVLRRKKFSEEKLDKMKWTMAPFCLYLGVKGKIDAIHHHNYFLGTDFTQYAQSVFSKWDVSRRPYYYVNVPSKHNPNTAPGGCESLFVLYPVADLRYKPSWDDRERVAMNLISDLSEKTRYDIKSNLLSMTILDPANWRDAFNLYKGSGLGLAHNMAQLAYFRPSNKDEKLKNLYYVGASTVPGTGLPMVTISSKLVVERIMHDN